MAGIKTKFTKGFWPGFVVGLLYFGYIFWWLWSLYPLETFGITSRFGAFWAILIIFLANVLVSALFWGVWSKYRGRTALAMAALFVIIEWLRSWSYGFLWYGSGTVLGPHWTFGNIAYLFTWLSSILKSASIWGIYGIDFILAFIFFCVLKAYRKKSFKELYIPFALIILVVLTGIFRTVNAEQKIPVAVIQTKTPSQLTYSGDQILADLRERLKLMDQASSFVKDGGIIVLPEGSSFAQDLTNILDQNSLHKYFQKISPKESLVIDNYGLQDKSQDTKSKTIFISTSKGVIGEYDKRILSPVGEYRPYWIKALARIVSPGFKNRLDSFRVFVPGEGPNVVAWQNYKIKTLVCSEITSPSYGRHGSSSFIVALNSLGNFHGSKQLESQLEQMARLRAVENGKYLVWASNYGRSYIIDNHGSIISVSDQNGYKILTGYIVPNQNLTWYNKIGDWPILLLSVVLAAISLL